MNARLEARPPALQDVLTALNAIRPPLTVVAEAEELRPF